jgi:hypothetical protein
MTEDDLNFRRIIFMSVLSMQYHPRNEIPPEGDALIIERCLRIAALAGFAFDEYFS